ncbi:MAG: class II aldolase/adducin family protein, partial [Phycisphaerae bacterium]
DAQVAAAAKLNAAMPGLPPHRPSSRERELRAELAAFVHRGYRQRLLTSKEGSFSVRIGPDRFLISPTAMDREKVGVEDMVLVADGQREAGKVPSRTAWLHRAVYRKHPGVQAVVNALPINATAFSCSGHRLDARTIPESYIFLRDVPVVPFSAFDGVGEALAGHVSLNQPAALLENNGALIVGKSCLDVFDRLEVLESTADTLITSRPLGPLCAMEEGHIKRLEEVFFPKVYGG